MKSISITTYRGFSKVKGKCSLQELIGWVRSRQYANLIEKIGRLVSEGKTKEAENVKRQLDYFTVTANYHECRLAHSIAAYNDTSTIDIDKLREEELERIRALIEADEATLACFLTAKQHGFKILAYLTDLEAEAWRNSFFKTATITYDRLEQYHAGIYELTRKHYEKLLQTEVDTSGKDLSRGVFASYDPKAFYSAERVARIPERTLTIEAPEPAQRGRKKKKEPETGQTGDISAYTCMEFNKCLCSTQRLMKYTEGSRNSVPLHPGKQMFPKRARRVGSEAPGGGKAGRRRRDGHGHTHRKRLHIYRQDGTGRGEEKDTTRGTGDRLSEQELCFQAKHGARPPRDVRLIPNGREIFLCHAEQGFQLHLLEHQQAGHSLSAQQPEIGHRLGLFTGVQPLHALLRRKCPVGQED